MFPPLVVELHPTSDAFAGLGDGVVGGEIDFLVFQATPEPFDEHVVHPAAFAIHADADIGVFERLREVLAGELASLVGVEDLRCFLLP